MSAEESFVDELDLELCNLQSLRWEEEEGHCPPLTLPLPADEEEEKSLFLLELSEGRVLETINCGLDVIFIFGLEASSG